MEILRRGRARGVPEGAFVTVTAMREEDLQAFLKAPEIMVCTDGGGGRSPFAHPRGAGSFPRVLGRYVREQGVLTLPEAVRKMTSLPARRMGFADRGRIAPGMKADLVLFDAARVRDTATVEEPNAAPVGIPHVLINGRFVVRDGKPTGLRPGEVVTQRPDGPR
jgi:N-acyl-D-amino-acid deacylase